MSAPAKREQAVTTVNNRNIPLRASRATRNVSLPSGKDEDRKEKGFFNRPLPGGKTPWDWLQLIGVLLIPLVIFLATMRFNQQQADLAQQQHANDQKIANQQHEADKQLEADQQQEVTLKSYLDDMSDLLLTHNLRKAKPGDEVSQVARERTLTTLRRLKADRNQIVLQFLQDAHLISVKNAVIDLSGADLSRDNLDGVNLPNTDLSHANLSGADLSHAYLQNADLSHAHLQNADLSHAFLLGAHLIDAFLLGAHLSGANLYGANLGYADLDGARLDGARLDGAGLLFAILNDADLSHAHLSGANLVSAMLRGANLGYADLNSANLMDADLSGANLSGTLINQQQLDQVKSCFDAILPPGLTCHQNQ